MTDEIELSVSVPVHIASAIEEVYETKREHQDNYEVDIESTDDTAEQLVVVFSADYEHVIHKQQRKCMDDSFLVARKSDE